MRVIVDLLTRWGWIGNGPWWRNAQLWLALAVLIVPFGWVLLLMPREAILERLQPVRVRVRDFIRR